jgi:hypothetical protein
MNAMEEDVMSAGSSSYGLSRNQRQGMMPTPRTLARILRTQLELPYEAVSADGASQPADDSVRGSGEILPLQEYRRSRSR